MKKDSLSISSVFKPTERYKTISWMGGEGGMRYGRREGVCLWGGGRRKVDVYGRRGGERYMFMGRREKG